MLSSSDVYMEMSLYILHSHTRHKHSDWSQKGNTYQCHVTSFIDLHKKSIKVRFVFIFLNIQILTVSPRSHTISEIVYHYYKASFHFE